MFLIIGVWGSRTRKLKAAYQFFLYTLLGSLFMLLAIFLVFFETGTTDFQILNNQVFSEEKEIFLWVAFFLSFSVKVPMVPVHIWLPEAHVEAPTAGSVILAGILLKMGTYGLLRYSICLFPNASVYFTPLVYGMSVIAIIYTSLTTLRQVDLKKIIAYSSVAHMAFVTIGIFTFNIWGVEGSMLIMLSHGFVSSALFLCIGILYDRHHTRLIKYYSGLAQVMPVYSFLFLFFSIANLGFPGSSSFVGEFLTLVGSFQSNTTVTFLASTGMITGAGYSLWLCNRILFGSVSGSYIVEFKDVNSREFAVLLPLLICTFWMGVYPELFLEPMHLSISNLLQKI
jgi:proton-translocating NADH-quinone oxidoreductase chain M